MRATATRPGPPNRYNSPRIQFNLCWLLQSTDSFLFAEEKLAGEFTKWNSNHGSVAEATDNTDFDLNFPQAFSHFAHHASEGKALVCDLQVHKALHVASRCHRAIAVESPCMNHSCAG